MNRLLVFVTLASLVVAGAGEAGAAVHATGVQITAGRFTLMVAYSGYTTPADPASQDGFTYLTDPQGLLFDLIANAQDQFTSLARAAGYHEIDINFPDSEEGQSHGVIFVNADKKGERVTLREVPFTVFSRELLREVTCSVWPIPDCRVAQCRGPKVETYLYRSRGRHEPRVFPKAPNLVLWGALPDPEMSGVYVLRPSASRERMYERLNLSPAETTRYFDPLER